MNGNGRDELAVVSPAGVPAPPTPPPRPAYAEATELLPDFSEKLNTLVQNLKKQGINIKVTRGLSSKAQQQKLYEQGRTSPGPVVTGRPGGYSWHEYGVAADVVPLTKSGQPDWRVPEATWRRIAAEAKNIGLVMGADIPPPTEEEMPPELRARRRIPFGHDYPHVQMAGLTAYPNYAPAAPARTEPRKLTRDEPPPARRAEAPTVSRPEPKEPTVEELWAQGRPITSGARKVWGFVQNLGRPEGPERPIPPPPRLAAVEGRLRPETPGEKRFEEFMEAPLADIGKLVEAYGETWKSNLRADQTVRRMLIDIAEAGGNVAGSMTSPENLALLVGSFFVPEEAFPKIIRMAMKWGFPTKMGWDAVTHLDNAYNHYRKYRETGDRTELDNTVKEFTESGIDTFLGFLARPKAERPPGAREERPPEEPPGGPPGGPPETRPAETPPPAPTETRPGGPPGAALHPGEEEAPQPAPRPIGPAAAVAGMSPETAARYRQATEEAQRRLQQQAPAGAAAPAPTPTGIPRPPIVPAGRAAGPPGPPFPWATPQALIDRAVTQFGITDDRWEAGFILPDGRMLDFSGKARGRPAGAKALNNSNIASVFGLPQPDPAAVDRFARQTGAIPVNLTGRTASSFTLTEGPKPTDNQVRTLRWFVGAAKGGKITWEIRDQNGNRVDRQERVRATQAHVGEAQRALEKRFPARPAVQPQPVRVVTTPPPAPTPTTPPTTTAPPAVQTTTPTGAPSVIPAAPAAPAAPVGPSVIEQAARQQAQIDAAIKVLQGKYKYPEGETEDLWVKWIEKKTGISLADPKDVHRAIAELKKIKKAMTTVAKAPSVAQGQVLRDLEARQQPGAAAAAAVAARTPQPAPEAGLRGDETEVVVPSGKRYGVWYEVVEGDTLTPSHDPWSFLPKADYPPNTQTRDYERNQNEQMEVKTRGQKIDPPILINTNPDGVNGPSVAGPSGWLAGGNGRFMSLMRAYRDGLAEVYRQALVAKAHLFGLDPTKIAAMREPVLIRRLKEEPADPADLVNELNGNRTVRMDPIEQAIAAGRALSYRSLDAIADVLVGEEGKEDISLREAMRENPQVFLDVLERDRIVSPTERAGMVYAETGALTEEAKVFIERAIMGSVIDRPGLLAGSPPKVLRRLERSIPSLARLNTRKDAWNIAPLVREALGEMIRMQSGKVRYSIEVPSQVEEWFEKQKKLFPEMKAPALVEAMVKTLLQPVETVEVPAEATPSGVPSAPRTRRVDPIREAFRGFSEESLRDPEHTQVMPGMEQLVPHPEVEFERAFGIKVSREELEQVLSSISEQEAKSKR